MKDYKITSEEIQQEFYPKMNRYLRAVQQNRSLPINDFPADYLEQFVKSKNSFLVPILFKDRLVWEKPLDNKLSLQTVVRIASRSKDKKIGAIYDDYSEKVRYLSDRINIDFQNAQKEEKLSFPSGGEWGVFRSSLYLKDCALRAAEFDPTRFNPCLFVQKRGEENGRKNKQLTIRKNSPIKTINRLKKFGVGCGFISEKNNQLYDEYINAIGGDLAQLQANFSSKGTLCLSLSPMDFLTASDNSLNWSSCFSLRAGCNYGHPLAMLTAKNIFMAYIKYDKDYELYYEDELDSKSQEYVSNKLKRAWVFADESTLTIDKVYPSESASFEKEIFTFVNELTNNYYSKVPEGKKLVARLNLQCAWDDGPKKITGYRPDLIKEETFHLYSPEDYVIDFSDYEKYDFSDFDPLDEGFYKPENLGLCKCDECGEWTPIEDLRITEKDERLCESCFVDEEEEE